MNTIELLHHLAVYIAVANWVRFHPLPTTMIRSAGLLLLLQGEKTVITGWKNDNSKAGPELSAREALPSLGLPSGRSPSRATKRSPRRSTCLPPRS